MNGERERNLSCTNKTLKILSIMNKGEICGKKQFLFIILVTNKTNRNTLEIPH